MKRVLQKTKKSQRTKTLLALSQTYLKVLPKESLVYARKAHASALEQDHATLNAETYNALGLAYASLSSYQEAQGYYRKALKIFIKNKNFKGQANVCQNLGLTYHFLGEHDIALNYFLKAIELANEHKGIDKTALFNNLGNIYKAVYDYDKALKYYNKALKISTSNNNRKHTAYALNNLGTIYKLKEDYEKALEHYEKSLEIKQNVNDEKGVASTYGNMANIYKRIKDYKKAYFFYDKAIDIFEELEDFRGLTSVYHNIAYTYLAQQSLKKALKYASLALDIINTLKDAQDLRQNNYELFYRIYFQKGSLKEALKYEALSKQVKDSLMTTERNEMIARIQARYDIDVKEKENELLKKQKQILKKDNEIKALKLSRSTNANYTLIIILTLALICLYIVYKSFQNKKRISNLLEKKVQERTENLMRTTDKLLKANKELDTFLYKASHDLKNPLSSLEGLCLVGLKDIEDAKTRMYFRKQHKVIQSMYLLLFRVSEIGDIRNHKAKMNEICLYRFNKAMVKSMSRIEGFTKVKIEIDIGKNQKVWTDTEMLDIVVDNILRNAIQHAQNYHNEQKQPRVSIESKDKGDTIEILISDNGNGVAEDVREKIFDMFFRATNAVPGFGLGLYKARIAIEKINGEIKLTKTSKEGSLFSIKIPKKPIT